MEQLLAHLVGDYVLQTSTMAERKTRSWLHAWVHAFVYTLPFLFLTRSPVALGVIAGTHAVFDRYAVARYVAALTNALGDPRNWRSYRTSTGYSADLPPWMAVWLFIIVDNTIHLATNYLALTRLA